MRRLLPGPADDAVDLDADYAVPDPPARHVRANMVASADGAASATGRSAGLSSPADKQLFALLRGHADAVLVGASTVRVENYGGAKPSAPRRAWRAEHGYPEVPPIVVVSRSGLLEPGLRLFTDTERAPLLLLPTTADPDRVAELGERAEVLQFGAGDVDIAAALDALADRGLRRVLCEGGPTLLAALAAAGLLDELCLTVSPLLLGGLASRILAGPHLPSPARLRLGGALEEDGYLFLRYLAERAG